MSQGPRVYPLLADRRALFALVACAGLLLPLDEKLLAVSASAEEGPGFERQADDAARRIPKFKQSARKAPKVSRVAIRGSAESGFVLSRDGQPLSLQGAGGNSHLELVKACGGNAIRTWGIDQLDSKVDGVRLADRARDLDLAIVAGIWLGHEENGFNYSDPAQVEAQRESVRAAVRKYKDEPALLIWGLGNEMEGPGSPGDDPRIWNEVNVLAGIVKKEDPEHPVMTVIAGASEKKVRSVATLCPDVDILGVNAYAGAGGVGQAVKSFGWRKPFVLTEFGPPGFWEVATTPWGAPIEPNSTRKAKVYAASQAGVTASRGQALGSFAFTWGYKQEATATWFGMFLPSGEKLGAVDEICLAWSGRRPQDRCPEIAALDSTLSGGSAPRGSQAVATVDANDPDGDQLSYEWQVVSENADKSLGGGPQALPAVHPDCILQAEGRRVRFKVPEAPGAYRLFVYVRDGRGSAATANFPFRSQ